jgi:alanine racemase
VGTPVVLLGHGVLAESHARVADTINYELVCGIEADPPRARRTVIDG